MTNTRDNEAWLRDLRAGSEVRDAALADLRAVLLRVLPQGISRLLSPENPAFEALIEDTVQETLLRTVNALDTFEGRSQFTTWVYKIAVRVALNDLRRRRWKDVSLDGLEDNEKEDSAPRQFTASGPLPETVVERMDMLKRVELILTKN